MAITQTSLQTQVGAILHVDGGPPSLDLLSIDLDTLAVTTSYVPGMKDFLEEKLASIGTVVPLVDRLTFYEGIVRSLLRVGSLDLAALGYTVALVGNVVTVTVTGYADPSYVIVSTSHSVNFAAELDANWSVKPGSPVMGTPGTPGTLVVSGGTGGPALLQGGAGGDDGGQSAGAGGVATVQGGTGGAAGVDGEASGGASQLIGGTGGAGSATKVGGNGGAAVIQGGAPGADGGAGAGAGGGVQVVGTSGSNGGPVTVNGGGALNPGGSGGLVSLTAGQGGPSDGSTPAGSPGVLTFTSAAGLAGSATQAAAGGGDITLTAGQGGEDGGGGGAGGGGGIVLAMGMGGSTTTAAAAGNGGAFAVTAGNGGSGSATGAAGDGGSITLTPGTAGPNLGGGSGQSGQTVASQGVTIATTVAKPTATAARRGQLWVVRGGAGVPDSVQMCMKTSTDTYAWETIHTAV